MKVVDIALKDLLRGFRSVFLFAFMFVMPLVTVALFWFAFGGQGGDGGFYVPTTEVLLVNQDEPVPQLPGFAAGDILAELLQEESLSQLLAVTLVNDPARARAAVDAQEAGVAVIVPTGFTATVFDQQGRAEVEVYQDPTLSLGPAIVKGIVRQFIDGFAGARIATEVASAQLHARGADVNEAVLQSIAMEYGSWSREQGEDWEGGVPPWLDVEVPDGSAEADNPVDRMLGLIMAGMMVFYVFFTGAATSQSILKEDEEGTLPRLFTTPTPQSTILAGKYISVFAALIIQTLVLVLASILVFGLDWGEPVVVVLVVLGMVVLGSSFGIFLNSLLRDTQQAGIIYGAVLNVVGWIGISRMFVATVPGTEQFAQVADTVSLLSPHGWAMRGWQEAMAGAGLSEVLLTVVVMLGLGAVFFVLGALRFRKRFA